MRYELRLLILLSLTNGVVALERLSASFLSPYLVRELGLSNAQLGLLASALSGAVAVSALVLGRLADASGRPKRILLLATLAFSLIAGVPAFVATFGGLLAARFVLGLAEGPVVPVSQAMMAAVSDPRRRGLNMGLLQMAGAFLIGGTLGPIVATFVADRWGWRTAFAASMLPGLIVAMLLWAFVRRDAAGPAVGEAARAHAMPGRAAMAALWRVRNVRLSILISGLFAAWFTIQSVFLPVYLTTAKGMPPATMGWVVGAGGIAGLLGGLGMPALSDLVGRRPVMIACGFLGVAAPAAILWLPADPYRLAASVLAGWLVIGISPLYIGVIPSESAPPGLTATAIGMCTAAGEILGGALAPLAAGLSADRFGATAPFWICIALAIATGVLAIGLSETLAAPDRAAGA